MPAQRPIINAGSFPPRPPLVCRRRIGPGVWRSIPPMLSIQTSSLSRLWIRERAGWRCALRLTGKWQHGSHSNWWSVGDQRQWSATMAFHRALRVLEHVMVKWGVTSFFPSPYKIVLVFSVLGTKSVDPACRSQTACNLQASSQSFDSPPAASSSLQS